MSNVSNLSNASNASKVIQRRFGGLLVALLVAGPPGHAGEVDGRGYAAWQKPPTADQPPDDYVADEYEHDVRTGEVFDLTDHYDLRQGPLEENKQRWKDSDRIEWTVNGATLKAKGQVHDADHHQATVATSEAWGAHYVEAEISAEEGDHATIEAENRISFRYSYLVSGRYVGEASVQLNAVAYDMKRKDHRFHLSEQSGESVESEEGRRTGSEYRVKLAGRKALAVSNKGAEGKLESSAELEYEQGEKLDVRIARRFRQSTGDSGGTPAVILHDEVSGATPLQVHYEVFSEGDVTLLARAGQIPGSEESSTVLVQLNEFRVENTLRVWTTVTWSRPPPGDPTGDPPPVPNPEPGGPITPGAGAGGGTDDGATTDGAADGTADGDGPREAEGAGSSDEPDADRTERADRTGGVALPLDTGSPVRAGAGFVAPHGLVDEPGSRAGRLRIELSAPAPRELRFAVVAEPPGIVAPASPEIVVQAGETRGGIHVHGAAPGRADASLRLLDEYGAPTDAVLVVPVQTASVSVHPAPRLWVALAGMARSDRRGTSVRALPGTDLGALRIGRTGFAGFFETATAVRLEVDDPDGVLEPLPSAVAIAAGTEASEVPLRLTAATGAATITLFGDDGQRIPVRVRSAGQAWRSVPRVRVPVGARVCVPVLFAEREPGGRPVEAASDSGACATVEDSADPLPGGRLAGVWVRAVAPGATTLRVSAPGLEDLIIAVEVIEPVVRLAAGRLEVDALAPTAEGEIVLWMPPGVRVDALDVPPELADHVDLQGLGTGKLVISLAADPDRPARLSFPIRFAGTPDGPFTVDVLDTVHAGAGEEVLHTVRVEVG